MAEDMRETIANAAKTLLFDKKVRKLTVKDIVEECHITRQTFYYHFEDIPDLMAWSLRPIPVLILCSPSAFQSTHPLRGATAKTYKENCTFFELADKLSARIAAKKPSAKADRCA